MACLLWLLMIVVIGYYATSSNYPRRIIRRGGRGRPRGKRRGSGKTPAGNQAAAAEGEAALTLARVVSDENGQVIDEIRLSMNKPAEYFSSYHTRYPNLNKPADVQPFFAALDALQARQLAGAVDRRATPRELKVAVDALVRARDIQGFDWAFLDAHLSSGSPGALNCDRMLNAVRNKFSEMGWVFFHIKIAWDNYDFALVRAGDFQRIAALKGPSFLVAQGFERRA